MLCSQKSENKVPMPGPAPSLIKSESLGIDLRSSKALVSFKSSLGDSDEQLEWRKELRVKMERAIKDTIKEAWQGEVSFSSVAGAWFTLESSLCHSLTHPSIHPLTQQNAYMVLDAGDLVLSQQTWSLSLWDLLGRHQNSD